MCGLVEHVEYSKGFTSTCFPKLQDASGSDTIFNVTAVYLGRRRCGGVSCAVECARRRGRGDCCGCRSSGCVGCRRREATRCRQILQAKRETGFGAVIFFRCTHRTGDCYCTVFSGRDGNGSTRTISACRASRVKKPVTGYDKDETHENFTLQATSIDPPTQVRHTSSVSGLSTETTCARCNLSQELRRW